MPYAFHTPLDGVGYVEIGVSGITSNIYVLGHPDEAMLIDAGSADTADEIIATLEAHDYASGGVRAIVITHGHGDHHGGAGALSAWSGAPVWAHLAAAANIEDHWGDYIAPGWAGGNNGPDDWQRFRAVGGEPVRVGRILREGEFIDHGGRRLAVLHMPGHERGLIALFERERRLAFVGDLVQGGMDVSENWLGLFSDVASQRRSLARLAELHPAWLFKGHRRPRSGEDVQADLSAAVGRLDAIERVLLAALKADAPLTVARAVRTVFREVLKMDIETPRDYAAVSVQASLIDLAQRGLARRNADLAWEPAGG